MNFDILIIGAGPAGLSAAHTAAQAGASVGVIDDNPLPGGQIWRQGPEHRASGAARALLDALKARPNVTLLSGTRFVQALPGRQLLAESADRALVLAYGKLIVASGARERFLPYPGWTLPGVTGAGGLQALIKGGMPVRGERIVIAGSGPLLWAAALTAHQHGASIAAIVEQAPPHAVRRFATGLVHTPAKLAQALRMRFDLRATPYWCGAHVAEALGTSRITQVRVRRGEAEMRVDCDRLACAYGLVPNTGIGAALGCALQTHAGSPAIAVNEWQRTSVDDIHAAGECTGVGGMELAAVEGRIAAHAALGDADGARRLFAVRERYRRFAARLHEAFELAPALRTLARADTVFCRCEDVAFGDVAHHASWRDAKLQTRCGMGPCQGKICGEAAAFCFGWPQNGQRPPFSPARIDTLLHAQTGA
ncbi:NADPH-dependent 2,4-dienoyl-CoA reductase/sulfur reductase-like enzyme [Paraburkholderia unamae]|uniref:FAD-dependent oxidoreductase n=1 Tax=Paraburkholderia unamae TaxID=219649 RepID=UPI000DC2B371|nr:FAD-dependent oxidoreductase [Paraburkholderia unamae]RAR68166.1 NADPH-dependent 2,4-dienoyl-CoA reductase/sulfur reductase-like enzyme [Paraburkholderia unamae]